METEDQILHQQTLLNSSSRRMSEHLAMSTAEVEMALKNTFVYLYLFSSFSYIDFSENVLLIYFLSFLQPKENGHHVSVKAIWFTYVYCAPFVSSVTLI